MSIKLIDTLETMGDFPAVSSDDVDVNGVPLTEALKGGNIVTPEQYGAVGDGVTDDTAAINQCLSENPNTTIVFSNKRYCISNTLHAYGNGGGQYVIVGGARIEWIGDENPLKAMYRMDLSGGKDHQPILEGGTWLGVNKVGYGVIVDGEHAVASKIRVLDATVAGISIGKETIDYDSYQAGTVDPRSLQATVNDCMVFTSVSNGAEWSDKTNRIGLLITESDNVINGFISNRMHKGVELRASGNVFNNLHVCAAYKTKLVKPAPCYAIFINPLKVSSNNGDMFNNCYFDNYTYIVGGAKPTIHRQVSISNSYYFYSGKQTTGDRVECYVTDGNVLYISIDGLTTSRSSSCILMDLYPSISNTHYHAFVSMHQNIHRNLISLNDSAYQLVCADNYYKSGEFASVMHNGVKDQGHVYHIGSIITPNWSSERFVGTLDITYLDRTYVNVTWKISHNSTDNGWKIRRADYVIGHYFNPGEFYIQESPDVITMDNGKSYKEYKLLFRHNETSTFAHGNGMVKIEHSPYCAVYFSHRKAFDVTDKNYNLDEYLQLPVKEDELDINETRVLFEGDSITKGDADNSYVPHFAKALAISNYTNNAVDGSGIAMRSDESTNAIVLRVDDVNFADYDMFVFGAGTNDWNGVIPLGEYDSTEKTTIFGAMNYILNKAYSDNPKIKIFFWTPLQRYKKGSTVINPHTTTVGGITLENYAKSIENYCKYKGINVINMFENSIINEYNWQDTEICKDGLHPGETGYVMLGERLANWIKSCFY